MKTKYICPICKSKKTTVFAAMEGYKLLRCLNCGFVWDPGFKRENIALYEKKYFVNDSPKGGYTNYFEGMKINRKTFADRLKKIEKRMGKKGRLLDVGCALGECLVEAKRLGWKDAEGVEVSSFASSFARKRGLKVTKGALGAKFKANYYDVVSYQDVIEHIPDPVTELKKAYRVLKPGGIIYLVTPNIGGYWSKILGPKWYHYKPGEHISYFDFNSTKKALSAAGFTKVESKRTYHILSIGYILNRLRYYSDSAFGMILKLVEKTPVIDVSIVSYTGELEAWATKPGK